MIREYQIIGEFLLSKVWNKSRSQGIRFQISLITLEFECRPIRGFLSIATLSRELQILFNRVDIIRSSCKFTQLSQKGMDFQSVLDDLKSSLADILDDMPESLFRTE